MDMYAMWLTCRMGSATVKTSALLKHFGSPEAIYHARSEELAAVARLTKQETEQLSRHELDDVKRLMERCNTLGIDVIHPWEEGYPALLGRIKNPPFTLFYRGKLSVVQRTLCIAIVGTRSCTRYGASVAEKLAGDLAALSAPRLAQESIPSAIPETTVTPQAARSPASFSATDAP